MQSVLYRKGDAFYAPGFELYADRRALDAGQGSAVHWHDYCEVELICGGEGTHGFNHRRDALQTGCAYFITPLDFHEVCASETGPLSLYHVQFGATALEDELMQRILRVREAQTGGIAVRLTGEAYTRLRDAFEELMEEFSARRSDGVTMLRACLARLTVLLLREAERSGTAQEQPVKPVENALIHQAVQFVQYNFRAKLTLADAAAHVHLSDNYFGELFFACMGMHFGEYLRARRLEYAHRLLTETHLSVSEIARESGFQSISHFTQVFRARYGATPTQMRSAYREKEEHT